MEVMTPEDEFLSPGGGARGLTLGRGGGGPGKEGKEAPAPAGEGAERPKGAVVVEGRWVRLMVASRRRASDS